MGNHLAPPNFQDFWGECPNMGSMNSVTISHTLCFKNQNRKGSASSDGHRQEPVEEHREEGGEEKSTSGPTGEIF